MNSKYECSVQEEVSRVQMQRPHLIVLGAGASRAVCSLGDKNGNGLPLMADFSEIVGLQQLFEGWGINPSQNFEEIFSDLFVKQDIEEIKQLQSCIEEYFCKLELPDKPTIYDHLILSLRGKDLIATFNWDPLLMQAYLRNQDVGLSLPSLIFLHGNVRVGYCEDDKTGGLIEASCKKCGKPSSKVPLLFPIKKKDYAKNIFIRDQWNRLKQGFGNAFMITIFGYGAPKADQEAITAMKEAWGDKYQRSMEQTEFITIESDNQTREAWSAFIHTHHYELHHDFYESWIANHPRRTGEAWINQYLEALFIDNNPIPRDLNFPELWRWYQQFKEPEK